MTISNVLIDKRRVQPEVPVAEYFHGIGNFRDAGQNVNVIKIFSGDWHVSSNSNDMFATILGSCISACIRDPLLGVGGMNHFLLPGEDYLDSHVSDSARYGVFAMECLINGLLKAGGHKDRFEVKVFGGGNVINSSSRIGSMNAQFIRSFLHKEGFRIVSEDMEGTCPRRLHYYPNSGKVMLRRLHRREDMAVLDEEALYTQKLKSRPIEGDIELF